MILLTLGASNSSGALGEESQMISDQFYKDASQVLDIYERIISYSTLLTTEEKEVYERFINTYPNASIREEELKIKKRIMKLGIYYYAYVDNRNPDTEENIAFLNKKMNELTEITKQLEELYLAGKDK
jgi:prefoldin subunit 5